jgi:DNA-binding winged helix-turn-helix (wHTH) protein
MGEVRCFGDFRFHPETGELFRSGEPVDLQNQPARVLDLLTGRPGVLVTREELRQALWGEDTHVDFDRSLNFCVRRIRVALGESTRSPLYLETLPKRGYRFLAPVTAGREKAASPRFLRATAAAFVLGLLGGAALAEDYGTSSLHRRLVDWMHQQMLAPGERCPWSSGGLT